MADSSVAITAGSGTLVDTRTVGTEHRQVVCVGDPTTNANVAAVDASGNLSVTLGTRLQSDLDSVSTEGTLATYGSADRVTAVATNATNVFVIGGSASKTIRIRRVTIMMSATSAGMQLVLLRKQSSADSGGTSIAIDRIALDSNDAASATDVVTKKYTANPTVGTLLGFVDGFYVPVPSTSTPAFAPLPIIKDFGINSGKALVLRGVAQQLAVSCNGTSLAGLDMTVSFTWTEV